MKTQFQAGYEFGDKVAEAYFFARSRGLSRCEAISAIGSGIYKAIVSIIATYRSTVR